MEEGVSKLIAGGKLAPVSELSLDAAAAMSRSSSKAASLGRWAANPLYFVFWSVPRHGRCSTKRWSVHFGSQWHCQHHDVMCHVQLRGVADGAVARRCI